MITPLTIVRVTPTGLRKTAAFVDYSDGTGEYKPDLELPVYPPSPRGEQLRLARIEAGVRLHDAASRLGISVANLCSLEHGRAVLIDEAAWDEAVKNVVTP